MKLSEPQRRLLASLAGGKPVRVAEYYPPLRKLRELGLVTFDIGRALITAAGIAELDTMMESELERILDVPYKFWLCPDHRANGRVEWSGPVATCLECGRTNQPAEPVASATHRMDDWLRALLGFRSRPSGGRYLLDAFSSDFYLVFDANDDPETPAAAGTVDVLIGQPGRASDGEIRILANAKESQICRLLFALGPSQFPESVRTVLYERNANVLRTEAIPLADERTTDGRGDE